MATQEESKLIRKHLLDAIRGHQAHVDFDSAVKDFPAAHRGTRPHGAPHSPWELLEHMRIAQHDILEFSRNPKYESPKWPEGYWPKTAAPPDDSAWDNAARAFKKDRTEFEKLISDLEQNLFEPIAHGEGQTLLREALLIASHNSYHLGQLMYAKKILTS